MALILAAHVLALFFSPVLWRAGQAEEFYYKYKYGGGKDA